MLLRAVKLLHLLPALVLSANGWASLRDTFLAVNRGKILVLLPWLMRYTNAAAARRRGTTKASSENEPFEKASPGCRHKGGFSTTGLTLLAKERALATEETFGKVRLKFGEEKAAVVAAAAEAAVATSRSVLASGREAA